MAVFRSGPWAAPRAAPGRGADWGRRRGFRAVHSAAGLPAACSDAPARAAATDLAAADPGRVGSRLFLAFQHLARAVTVGGSTIRYRPEFRALHRGTILPAGSFPLAM